VTDEIATMVPVSRLAEYENGRAFKPEDFTDEGLPVIRIREFLDSAVEPDRFNGEVRERNLVLDGDLLFAWSATLAVGFWRRGPAVLNQHLFRVTAHSGIEKSFLRWALDYAIVELAGHMHGSAMTHITREMLKQVKVWLPGPSSQRGIADFLDGHTAKIDVLIEKQERLIETLAERRQAVISHAVTKGLDSTAPMKDSGVEWLGTIPVTWSATKLKYMSAVQTGLTLGKTVPPDDAIELPYLRVANVQTNGVNLDEVKTVFVDRSEWTKYRLRDGDVLMTEGGDIDKLGRGCLWSNQIAPCVHQNHVFAVRCSAGLDSGMLVYLLAARVARSYFQMTAKRATNLASTNSTTLGNLPIALPGIVDQIRIVEHLDQQTAQIDALSAKAREMIDVLKERRQALISAAVTGKIDVRGLS